MSTQQNAPSPALLFDTLSAYQNSAALKAAIELGIFTTIAEGRKTAVDIAARAGAVERGVRILCDKLVILGFLTKSGNEYENTRDTGIFLNQQSPAYMGNVVQFMSRPGFMDAFNKLP